MPGSGHVGLAGRSLGDSCQSGKMAALLNSLFSVFKIIIILKMVQWDIM